MPHQLLYYSYLFLVRLLFIILVSVSILILLLLILSFCIIIFYYSNIFCTRCDCVGISWLQIWFVGGWNCGAANVAGDFDANNTAPYPVDQRGTWSIIVSTGDYWSVWCLNGIPLLLLVTTSLSVWVYTGWKFLFVNTMTRKISIQILIQSNDEYPLFCNITYIWQFVSEISLQSLLLWWIIAWSLSQKIMCLFMIGDWF